MPQLPPKDVSCIFRFMYCNLFYVHEFSQKAKALQMYLKSVVCFTQHFLVL